MTRVRGDREGEQQHQDYAQSEGNAIEEDGQNHGAAYGHAGEDVRHYISGIPGRRRQQRHARANGYARPQPGLRCDQTA